MKNLFRGYYEPDFNNLEVNGIIVVDTNVLLSVYRVPPETRKNILDTLTKVKAQSRLWIPYYIAWEYHKNLNSTLLQQKNDYEGIVNLLGISKLVQKVEEKYRNRHSTLPVDEIKEILKKTDADIIKVVNEAKKKHIDEKSIMEDLADIFKDIVGDKNIKIDDLKREAKERYEKRIPPGYMDASKKDNSYGDYIIWSSLIGKAKNEDKPLIFITNDRKEDWWLVNGKVKIGPNPKLRQEFYEKTNNEVYLYTFKQFAEKMKDKLSLIVTENDIDEINKVEPVVNRRRVSPKKRISRHIVKKVAISEMEEWFYTHYQDPNESCPYDSEEGGFIYIWGGPYDPEEELFDNFSGTYPESLIKEAAEKIIEDTDIHEWSGEYPEEEPEF